MPTCLNIRCFDASRGSRKSRNITSPPPHLLHAFDCNRPTNHTQFPLCRLCGFASGLYKHTLLCVVLTSSEHAVQDWTQSLSSLSGAYSGIPTYALLTQARGRGHSHGNNLRIVPCHSGLVSSLGTNVGDLSMWHLDRISIRPSCGGGRHTYPSTR